jgi:hypothetical protein
MLNSYFVNLCKSTLSVFLECKHIDRDFAHLVIKILIYVLGIELVDPLANQQGLLKQKSFTIMGVVCSLIRHQGTFCASSLLPFYLKFEDFND